MLGSSYVYPGGHPGARELICLLHTMEVILELGSSYVYPGGHPGARELICIHTMEVILELGRSSGSHPGTTVATKVMLMLKISSKGHGNYEEKVSKIISCELSLSDYQTILQNKISKLL